MKRNAFTLIELLVVIAIISILAAILFPVFAQAREKARQTSCASNEKQLGLAFLQYTQDYDEMFPVGTYGNYGTNTCCDPAFPYGVRGFGWAGEIYPYVKSTGVFACPDDPNSGSATGVEVSYFYNSAISASNNVGGGVGQSPEGVYGAASKFSSPARTVLAGEMQGFEPYAGTHNGPGKYLVDNAEFGGPNGIDFTTTFPSGVPVDPSSEAIIGTATSNTAGPTSYWTGYAATGPPGSEPSATWFESVANLPNSYLSGVHTSGSNFLCADGHVKWLRSTNVSFGFAALSQTGVDRAVGNYGSTYYLYAEGTGTNTHTLTFSPI